ncbi:MAG: BPSS1780 family membrane protein, partial [Burkholderiaceae bacterium]
GSVLALALLPAATLGLMVGTLDAHNGKFPMPKVLATAFRSDKARRQSMLVLGLLYAAGILLIMGVTWLIDDGKFANLYLLGGPLSKEMMQDSGLQTAARVALVLYIPLSLLFWHAPALVHWYGVPPTKALFFSLIACLRNLGAYCLYALAWGAVFAFSSLMIVVVFTLLGMAEATGAIMVGLALTIAVMFFSSIYFTFRDSFVHEALSDMTVPPKT